MCTFIACYRLLQRVEDVQNALNSSGNGQNENEGIMLVTMKHLCKNSDAIVREVLALAAIMLFGGNKNLQVKL